MNRDLIIFDLDGTLTDSKAKITETMSIEFARLLTKYQVAVISGCAFNQFKEQFVLPLIAYNDPFPKLFNLYLLPTCGSQMYEYAGREAGFHRMYHNDLVLREKVEIYNAWQASVSDEDFLCDPYGEIAEDRESQITFSMCGQEAPLDIKKTYDKDGKRRIKIMKAMESCLSDKYAVRIGGTTSIDVTRAGIDKAYGINKLLGWLDFTSHDAFFVGDALFPGGNDHAARSTGVLCRSVTGPEETIGIIRALNSMTNVEDI